MVRVNRKYTRIVHYFGVIYSHGDTLCYDTGDAYSGQHDLPLLAVRRGMGPPDAGSADPLRQVQEPLLERPPRHASAWTACQAQSQKVAQ